MDFLGITADKERSRNQRLTSVGWHKKGRTTKKICLKKPLRTKVVSCIKALNATFSKLTTIFQVDLFWILLEQMMLEVVVTTGAIRCAKLQSNRHHQETNTQIFTGRMLFLSPIQQCHSTVRNKALNANV